MREFLNLTYALEFVKAKKFIVFLNERIVLENTKRNCIWLVPLCYMQYAVQQDELSFIFCSAMHSNYVYIALLRLCIKKLTLVSF